MDAVETEIVELRENLRSYEWRRTNLLPAMELAEFEKDEILDRLNNLRRLRHDDETRRTDLVKKRDNITFLVAAKIKLGQLYGQVMDNLDHPSHEIAFLLQNTLSGSEADTFGGLWFHKSKLVIAFTRNGEETIYKYKYLIPDEAMPYIEIKTVKYPLTILLRNLTKFEDNLREVSITKFYGGVIFPSNSVDMTLSKDVETDFENAIQSGKLIVPETVKDSLVTGPLGIDPMPIIEPSNGANNVTLTPLIIWSPITGATGYDFKIATDGNFTNIVESKTNINGTSYTPTVPLSPNYLLLGNQSSQRSTCQ